MARDRVTGKPRQISRGFRGSPKAARKALAVLVQGVSVGRAGPTTGTVAHLIDRWLAHAGPTRPRTPSTLQVRRPLMALPTLGHIELRRLSASDLDALHDGMRASGSAPATIHKVHGTICRALNQVVLGERERGQPPPPA